MSDPGLLSRTAAALRRTNYAARTVTLAEGALVTAGAAAALLARGRRGDAALIAGIGALGFADDVIEPLRHRAGADVAKGLRGHLGALAHGRLTTGAAKAIGIPVLCVVAAAAAPGAGRDVPRPAGVLLDAGIAASAANLANLLDLRPGRALKVVLPLATALGLGRTRGRREEAGRTLARVAAAAALIALPSDLGERGMLGDTGANALGALVGTAAARRLGTGGRVCALLTLAALNLASERVSFSAVIEATPALRALDHWGRREDAS